VFKAIWALQITNAVMIFCLDVVVRGDLNEFLNDPFLWLTLWFGWRTEIRR
jgi:hypothetical protein